MTNPYSTFLSFIVVAGISLTALVLTANAQERLELSGVGDATYDIEVRATDDCDDSDDTCEPAARGDASVTKEVDKATPAESGTNVCDGVTCSDGSCAATADQCAAAPAASPEYRDTDSDGDGYGDAAPTDSQRPIREGGRTIDAGTVPENTEPEIRDEDSDNDGIDDGTMRAQDYNSSRSNKASRAAFSASDIDTRPEVVMLASGFFKFDDIDGDSGSRQAEDGEVVCWGQAEGEDGRVYAWGQGVCVALQAAESASSTTGARVAALEVRGEAVRTWSEEERAAWREYQENKATSTQEERLATKMVTQTQANQRIESIEADDSEVVLRYQTQMRVLGIFPIERTLTASAAADGEVVINYPWYRFFSQVPDDATIKSILTELRAELLNETDDQTTPLLYQ